MNADMEQSGLAAPTIGLESVATTSLAARTGGEAVRLAVIGAGGRGRSAYGDYCLRYPERSRVVAVAEPDPVRREAFAAEHGIPPELTCESWEDLSSLPAAWDAVVIATPDRLHVAPAIAAMERGWDILLEKPIAPSEAGVLQVLRVAEETNAMVAVSHVLRYTPFFTRIKSIVEAGRLGDLMAIQHNENIGYWHFAHSYVRGHWRRTDESSPMIVAKACHDMDVVRWIVDAPCTSVASMGGLAHFRPENAPHGAPDRCTDGCPVADSCPFYAPRYYIDRLGDTYGPAVAAMTADPSLEGRMKALRTGPYGRCVYHCDNDVADHQAVIASFANGVVASFMVSAFTPDNTRTLKIMGTRGELRGRLDTGEIEIRSFLPDMRQAPDGKLGWGRDELGRAAPRYDGREVLRVVPVPHNETEVLGDLDGSEAYRGHEGGDDGLMDAFVSATAARRDSGRSWSEVKTSLEESVESHLMAFAAERSRTTGAVVPIQQVG